ncbi:YveK family protein [Bacillus wiedmannii]|uniref:YveK family protein n=1 Tax=Bacillus wiedmannii TaxID=1890302 RepID=UPI000BEF8E8E|nr:Wzz/FepE/Etk N-terminal domain-containing protein [Bacillus wiedmannii]PEO38855.1 hypothetical protein CN555_11335 [Bacillus wiedmannii]
MKQEFIFKNMSHEWKSKWYVILIFPLLFSSFVWMSRLFILPDTYTSSAQLLLLPKNDADKPAENEIRLNIQLMNTFVNIAKSSKTLNQVERNLKLNPDEKKYLKNVEIITNETSLVMDLKTTNQTAKTAQHVTNEIATIIQAYMNEYFPGSQVVILEPAGKGDKVSYATQYILACIIGLWCGLAYIFLQSLLSTVIRTKNDLAQTELLVLGSIPYQKNRSES